MLDSSYRNYQEVIMSKLKKFTLYPLSLYQRFSKLTPPSCRYYPTCSEYARWQFEYNHVAKAMFATTKRILSCNPLFAGGIDYPSVTFQAPKSITLYPPNPFLGKITIIYWFVPLSMECDNQDYYVIKDFDAIKRST
jgi:putative membrane protein insertion efficiency factor